jgi:hypothetical protein
VRVWFREVWQSLCDVFEIEECMADGRGKFVANVDII